MLSVKAIYDGDKIHFFENVNFKEPREVIITFLNKSNFDLKKLKIAQRNEVFVNDISSNEIHYLLQEGKAFDFLNNKEEDIYSDNDLKIKY